MERQIVAMTAFAESETMHASIIALCNDGSLWVGAFKDGTLVWETLPNVPPISDGEGL